MQYALLACAPPGDTDRAARPIPGSLAALLGRLAAVLAAVCLIFNQGRGGGRAGRAAEAIHLGRALADLMPDDPEILAQLTLMLLHDARKAARLSDGQVVPLDDQDPTLRDTRQTDQGRCCRGGP